MTPARPGRPEIERRILENAIRYFPELAGAALVARCDPFRETSSYPLVRCRLYGAGAAEPLRSLVVKFPPVWPDNVEAETEFRQLSKMIAAVGNGTGPLRVPRPLDDFADWAALVTEQAGGARFSRVLLRDASRLAGRPARERLAGTARLCGRWLSAFHTATAAGEAPAFGGDFVEDLARRVAFLSGCGLPAATAGRVGDTAGLLADWGRAVPARVADFHGDYGPQNIHVGNDWVCVFDLSYNRTAIVYDDLTYFVVTLETMSPWPRHPLFSRARALALREPFLQGYGAAKPRAPAVETLLAGYHLKALVYRCAKQRGNVAARGRAAAWVFDRAYTGRRYTLRLDDACIDVRRRLDKA